MQFTDACSCNCNSLKIAIALSKEGSLICVWDSGSALFAAGLVFSSCYVGTGYFHPLPNGISCQLCLLLNDFQ